MQTGAYCLVCDDAYLPFALLTAATLRAFDDTRPIYVVDIDRACTPPRFRQADAFGVTILPADPHLLARCPSEPSLRSTFARLMIDELIPGGPERLVYVDADMLIVSDGLACAFDIDLGGHVLGAAIDMVDFKSHENSELGAQFRAYRHGLGQGNGRCLYSNRYFNAGLMVIDRVVWRREGIGEQALAFALANRERCQFHDQSALNVVLVDKWLALPPALNFMGDFMLLGVSGQLKPSVLHFVNRPKPWEGRAWLEMRGVKELYGEWLAHWRAGTVMTADELSARLAAIDNAYVTPSDASDGIFADDYREAVIADLSRLGFWPD